MRKEMSAPSTPAPEKMNCELTRRAEVARAAFGDAGIRAGPVTYAARSSSQGQSKIVLRSVRVCAFVFCDMVNVEFQF